ncbi:hypothetical protein [Aquimarina algiphila]|uniref:hypothetical protein n=1 Tax=Aquimarina algiphila TaxID=2047982 RepID=UPI00232F36CE|nr:hypothetical protein [Aquimarina algiphila]
MENKEDYKKLEQERLNDLKNNLIIHFHADAAFYERRTYIIFFIISGFGLYACLDLYKNITCCLIILLMSTVLFIFPLLLSIISNEFARKKSIYKAEYFQSQNEIDRGGVRKYIKWENSFKVMVGICYLFGVCLLAYLYYQNFPIK